MKVYRFNEGIGDLRSEELLAEMAEVSDRVVTLGAHIKSAQNAKADAAEYFDGLMAEFRRRIQDGEIDLANAIWKEHDAESIAS